MIASGKLGRTQRRITSRAVNLRGDLSGLIVAKLQSSALTAHGRAQGHHRQGGRGTPTQHGKEVIMNIFDNYQSRYEGAREEELTINEYLEICKTDPSAYATAAERLLMAIGEPELVDAGGGRRRARGGAGGGL